MPTCFIGLGGNLGDTFAVFQKAINLLQKTPHIFNLKGSRLFKTSAVSPLAQPAYLNAVCCFESTLEPEKLFERLEEIETLCGKTPKSKEAPRVIDLDLLFYGSKIIFTPGLIVPHPLWHTRLFVLRPLADLAETLHFCTPLNIQKMVSLFPNHHNEIVIPINKRLL